MPAHDYASVFLVDLNLRTFQPFTNDQARLGEAVQRLAGTATANFRPEARRTGDVVMQKLDPNTPPTASADAPGGSATVAERQRFLASLHRADKKMVCRKSILYFAENLPVTDRLKPKFDAIIGQANRANITFYPVDAAGLRLHSKEAEVSRNVTLAGAQGIGDAERDPGPWTKELQRQDQLLASRPTAVLGRLAKETGGFLLENTNNLAAGVARMQQERKTYYLLGYQPANATMDGKFRRVAVKVTRRNVTVRARPGYLAVPQELR